MPNWCWQYIELSGDQTVIKRFLDAVTADAPDGVISILNTFMPCPPELTAVASGVATVKIDGVDTRIEEWRDIDKKIVPLTADERADLVQRFGTTNWYRWGIANWGTKWPDNGVVLNVQDTATLRIETAWASPKKAFKAIAKQFIGMEWKVVWAEEGGDGGYYYIDNEEEANEAPPDSGKE